MMKSEIKTKIEKAEAVCILTHVNEDTDAVGSALAMREALQTLGKRADVYVEDVLDRRITFLSDEYFVYEPQMLKKYDLAIAVDCGSEDRLGKRVELFKAAADTVCIDHHGTNTGFAAANYVEADAAATGQILFYLFSEWGWEITKKTAEFLYAAITADCGSFKYSNATEKTFSAAGRLIAKGINHAYISKKLFDTCPENVMRMKGYLMNSVKCYADGKVAIISTDGSVLEKFGVEERDAGNLVDIPRQIEGVRIAAEIKQRSGKIRVSLRSEDGIDVSGLAVRLGGGGHAAAAGATLKVESLEEAEKLIAEECIKLL